MEVDAESRIKANRPDGSESCIVRGSDPFLPERSCCREHHWTALVAVASLPMAPVCRTVRYAYGSGTPVNLLINRNTVDKASICNYNGYK